MNEYESSLPPRGERQKKSNNDTTSFFQELLSIIKYVLVLLVVFFFTYKYFYAPVMVEGDSMKPTLLDGDYILLNKFSDIEPFDIVVFPPPDDEDTQYIKRVIGMPGDRVEYHEDILYINGDEVDEFFLDNAEDAEFYSSGDYSLLTLLGVEEVPAGQYFVLGDNRLNSRDSRSFGFVDEEAIIGKAAFRYWPFDRIGRID